MHHLELFSQQRQRWVDLTGTTWPISGTYFLSAPLHKELSDPCFNLWIGKLSICLDTQRQTWEKGMDWKTKDPVQLGKSPSHLHRKKSIWHPTLTSMFNARKKKWVIITKKGKSDKRHMWFGGVFHLRALPGGSTWGQAWSSQETRNCNEEDWWCISPQNSDSKRRRVNSDHWHLTSICADRD